MTTTQNKICSLNIIINNNVVNKTPILFRIFEMSSHSINDIIISYIDNILNIVYDNIEDINDISNVKLSIIVYDIASDDDEYETSDIDINDYINYDNEHIKDIITNKINEYSNLLLKKININELSSNFRQTYELINKHNDQHINYETFIQYIMSCFTEEYGNNEDIKVQIRNIMK